MNEIDALMPALQRKEGPAQEQFYLLTKDRVRFYLLSRRVYGEELAEIMSDCYVTAFESAGRFRGESSALTWLFGIVRNKCWEAFRRRERKRTEVPDPGDCPDAQDYAATAALSVDLREALGSLSKEEYQLFLDKICFCMTYEEISRVRSIPVGTLKRNIFEIREKLQRQLREVP